MALILTSQFCHKSRMSFMKNSEFEEFNMRNNFETDNKKRFFIKWSYEYKIRRAESFLPAHISKMKFNLVFSLVVHL